MPAGFKRFSLRLPCGLQQKWPRIMQGHQHVCYARLKPCLRWRGIEAAMLESVRQRKRNNNSCGQQYVCDHSVHRGEPPFAKSFPRAGFPLELSRKHRRVHLPYPLKVHYVDAPFRFIFQSLAIQHRHSRRHCCDFNRNVSRPANSIETVATAKISTVAPVATITAAQAATPSIVPNVLARL